MTFIPLLGYYLLRPSRGRVEPLAERRERGLTGKYYRVVGGAIDHRWMVLGLAVLLLVGGGLVVSQLKIAVLPERLVRTSRTSTCGCPRTRPLAPPTPWPPRSEAIVRRVAGEYGTAHPGEDGKPREVLKSMTTFVGGGGPRFWFSVAPELHQPNYAQLIIEVADKHDTGHLAGPLQRAFSAEIPGARLDVRQLETGKPVGIPVAVRDCRRRHRRAPPRWPRR